MTERRKTVLFLAILFLAFGIVGRMDYEEEQRQEAVGAALAVGRDSSRQSDPGRLAECLPLPGEVALLAWAGEGERARLECRVVETEIVGPDSSGRVKLPVFAG